MSVDEFIAASKHPLKKEVELLRKIIKDALPKMGEHIKWNAPSYHIHTDDRITFNLSRKDAVRIIFHRGAKTKPVKSGKTLIDTTSPIVEWPAPDRAVVTFVSLDQIHESTNWLTDFARQWIDVTS